jgi:hypothetical protein
LPLPWANADELIALLASMVETSTPKSLACRCMETSLENCF